MIETQTQHTHKDKTITLNVTEILPRLDAKIEATEDAIKALRDKYGEDPFSESADFLNAKRNALSLTKDLNILKKRKEELELQQKADTPEKRIQHNAALLQLEITKGLREIIPQDIIDRNDPQLIADYITKRLADHIAEMIQNNQLQGPDYATILATAPDKNLRAPVTIEMTSGSLNKADETEQVAKAAYTTEQKKENPDDQATLFNEYTAFLSKSNLERLVISLRLKLQRNEAEYARHLEGKKVYEAKANKKGGTDFRDLSDLKNLNKPEEDPADDSGKKSKENGPTQDVLQIWLSLEEYTNLVTALNKSDVVVSDLTAEEQELLFRVIEIQRALNPVPNRPEEPESLINTIDSRITLADERRKKIHEGTAKKFTRDDFTAAFNNDKNAREQYQAIVLRIKKNIH